jgi:hypothetical protein
MADPHGRESGHMAYYAVPGNSDTVDDFRHQATRHWYQTLRRRSHRTRITWTRMGPLAIRLLPRVRVTICIPSPRRASPPEPEAAARAVVPPQAQLPRRPPPRVRTRRLTCADGVIGTGRVEQRVGARWVEALIQLFVGVPGLVPVRPRHVRHAPERRSSSCLPRSSDTSETRAGSCRRIGRSIDAAGRGGTVGSPYVVRAFRWV